MANRTPIRADPLVAVGLTLVVATVFSLIAAAWTGIEVSQHNPPPGKPLSYTLPFALMGFGIGLMVLAFVVQVCAPVRRAIRRHYGAHPNRNSPLGRSP
jgi:hypothetical protein